MSSKSIRIILSYTVSKLTRFFETQCIYTERAVWSWLHFDALSLFYYYRFLYILIQLNVVRRIKGKKGKGTVYYGVKVRCNDTYGVSLAIWDHTVLPSTRHKWIHPTLTPARQNKVNIISPIPGGSVVLCCSSSVVLLVLGCSSEDTFQIYHLHASFYLYIHYYFIRVKISTRKSHYSKLYKLIHRFRAITSDINVRHQPKYHFAGFRREPIEKAIRGSVAIFPIDCNDNEIV